MEWLASGSDKSATSSTASLKKNKTAEPKPSQGRSVEVFKPCVKEVNIVYTSQSDSWDNVSRFVCNELLAYVSCYRDKSNVDALRHVVLNYFSYEEITAAKKLVP